MAETKTKPTSVSVEEFIANVPDPQRREDARTVAAMMERITGEKPRMWGPTIIGFGSYHYRYESGHEGDSPRLGFSPRAKELVLYVLEAYPGKEEMLARLGKHRIGKSCLYIKKLADVDLKVVEELTEAALAYMDEKYPRAA
jgi:hypothetical protein